MKTHIDNLLLLIPDLPKRMILDLGSGSGGFLIESTKRGWSAVGLELNKIKIEKAYDEALNGGVKIDIKQGVAENIPFDNNSFDFINVSEVIEHVHNPKKTLEEVSRVMRPGGIAYISVHNRFGVWDTHFRIYFLGWLPRWVGKKYITLLNKDRDYENMPDSQRINEMHYFTYKRFSQLAQESGFGVLDIREGRINDKFGRIFKWPFSIIYKIVLRPLCFSTFHILLRK